MDLRLLCAVCLPLLLLAGSAAAAPCNTCQGCSTILRQSGAAAELSGDIAATSDCIIIEGNNSVLDCGSFLIRGENGAAGVTVRRASLVTIRNCRIINFSRAIRLEEASNATIENCALEHGKAVGDLLYVRGGEREHYNHHMAGVTLDGKPLRYIFEQAGGNAGVDGDGLVFVAWSPGVSVRDVNLSYGDGLRLHHSPSVAVNNVTIQGSRSTCISAYMSPGGAYSRNALQGCSESGIELDASTNSTLRSNSVSGSGGRGLRIAGTACADYEQSIDASNLVNGVPPAYLYAVSGNITINDTAHLSVYCSSGLNVNGGNVSYGDGVLLYKVSGSSLSNVSTDGGIKLESSSGNNLTSCSVSSKTHGLWLVDSNNNTISSNAIASAGGDGILLWSSGGNILSGNVVQGAAEDGIVVDRSKDVLILATNVTRSGKSGFFVTCSQGISIIACNSSYNSLYGIRVNDGPRITVEESTSSWNSREGLHVEGQDTLTEYVILRNNIFGNSPLDLMQAVAPHPLSLYRMNQGNYWGRPARPGFVAGVDSSRLDITDLFPYTRLSGWLYMPVVASVSIAPANAKASGPVNCTFLATSQRHASFQANVTWTRNATAAVSEITDVTNGTNVTRQLVGLHKRGENWSCSVTPFDGEEVGYAISSANATVVNSEPSYPLLYAPASNATLYGRNVTFSYSSSDADRDNITYYIYVDGFVVSVVATNTTTLAVAPGTHHWSVKAWDGFANSSLSDIYYFTLSEGSAPPGGQGSGSGQGSSSSLNISFPDRIEMKQNEVRTYPFGVRNPGDSNYTVAMEAVSSSCYGCSFRMDPPSLALAGGQTVYFQLTVTVPISQPSGEYGITIKALNGTSELARRGFVLNVTELPVICAMGEERCDGDRVVACNVYKTGWIEKQTCEYGCINATCKSEPQMCSPNAVECSGNRIRTCNSRGNAWVDGSDCIFGCKDGACVAGIDPGVIIMPLAVTIAVVSGIIVYFYMKAHGRRKGQDQEREWRRLESRYDDTG